MEKFNVNDFLTGVKKEYGLGKGEYLKAKEGDNKMRILSNPVAHAGNYKGQQTFKFLMFVIDRTDNKIKPYFMPVMVMEFISNLQLDSDWGFDGFPMPYDINVVAKGAGTKEVKYSLIASPNKTEVSIDILEELKTKDILEFQKKLNAEQANQPIVGATDKTDNIGEVPPVEDLDNISF